MKAYEAFSSWVRSAIGWPCLSEPRPVLAGPDGGEGLLRREALAELDHRAADGLAERDTVAAPGLLGLARPCGVAVAASDALVGHPEPQVCACVHWIPHLNAWYTSFAPDSSSPSSSRERPV